MSVYELWKYGVLDAFINMGIIRTTVITYCNIYDNYIAHRQAGKSFTDAVRITSEEMSTSPETVKRAIAEVV